MEYSQDHGADAFFRALYSHEVVESLIHLCTPLSSCLSVVLSQDRIFADNYEKSNLQSPQQAFLQFSVSLSHLL